VIGAGDSRGPVDRVFDRGTFEQEVPAERSFASTKGPSVTSVSPSRTRTVVALVVAASSPPSARTPAAPASSANAV